MTNKNLQQVIDNIHLEQEELAKKIESETDEYKKHDLQFELDTVTNEKLDKIYREMVDNLPEENYEKFNGALQNIMGEDYYQRFYNNVLSHNPNATYKDFFEGVSISTVISNFDTLIGGLADFMPDKTIEKVATTVQNYVPAAIDNTPIHPYSERIENIKKGEKFNSLSQEQKSVVGKQLDEINEVIKESPRRYSEAQTGFDADYERIINKSNNEFYKKYLNEINKDFGKAYDYYDLCFTVKDDVADDEEKIRIAQSPSFKLSQQTQNSILRVWKKMDELNIISAGDGRETGGKIYGFQKLYDAKKQLSDALKEEQFDKLGDLKSEYEKQLQNVRDMYDIIKTELNPTPDKIPGNVQNFRENFVPAEFKNNICINATFNAMYNAYSIVKSMGITPEEFLKNPQTYIEQNFNNELTKFHIDKIYGNLSFEETLARVYADKSKAGINIHGMPRMVSTLTYFEKDEAQKENNLIYAAVQSGKVGRIFDDEQISYNYFTKERTKTFINLLLANPEDKDFIKMKSYDSLTTDKLHKTKAFDLASYLKNNNISSNDVYERVSKLLTTAYNLSYTGEKQYKKDQIKYDKLLVEYKKGNLKNAPESPESCALSKSDFGKMVKDVQQGIMAFVMLSNPERDNGMERLVGVLKDPMQALKGVEVDETYVQELNKFKNKDVVLNENLQRAKLEGRLNVEDVREKEKAYNKLADKILKDANKISAKVAKTTDEKRIEELQKQSVLKMNELKQLQKAETERLSKESKAGNIPSDYYKKRIENIISLRHNEKVAIFDDGLDKKQFIKSTGLEQLTKGEAEKLYESEIAKQKIQKDIFINAQFLQSNKLISTNNDVEVQQANFEQVDVSQIESVAQQNQREPLVVEEAKIESSSQKTQPQEEIEPQQKVKMP